MPANADDLNAPYDGAGHGASAKSPKRISPSGGGTAHHGMGGNSMTARRSSRSRIAQRQTCATAFPLLFRPGQDNGDWVGDESPSRRSTPQHVAPSGAGGSDRALRTRDEITSFLAAKQLW